VRLEFFIKQEEKELEEIKNILEEAGFKVRAGFEGFSPKEIIFLKDGEKKGFCTTAHKLLKELPCREVPDVTKYPFLVRVGNRWSREGLCRAVEGYYYFMISPLNGKSDEEVINSCKEGYIELPWGGVSRGENKKLLAEWLRIAGGAYNEEKVHDMGGVLELVEEKKAMKRLKELTR